MILLLWLALLPSLIIGFIIYRADSKEKEPKGELLKAFLFGFVAVVLTLIVSYILGINKIKVEAINTFQVAIYSFLGISLIEEFSKWLCSYLFLRKNNNFDYLFDGIVYTTFVSLGFATIENILYTFAGGLSTAIIRAITTVPAHAFFGISSGYLISMSKKEKKYSASKSNILLVMSFIMPFVLHGFYDFCLLTQNEILFNVYLIFVVTLYSVSIYQVKRLMEQESRFN